jgi:hypothetical protein
MADQPESGVLDHHHDHPARCHPQEEGPEGQVHVGQGQQVGQVGDRQEQRGGVGHPHAGELGRPGRHPGSGRGRDRDRREEHDRGVEAERDSDRCRHQHRQGQQPPRVTAQREARTDGAEEPLAAGDLCDDQDGQQEDHDRQQPAQCGEDPRSAERAGRQGQARAADPGQCLHPAAGVQVRHQQQDDQRQHRRRVAVGVQHRQSLPAAGIREPVGRMEV